MTIYLHIYPDFLQKTLADTSFLGWRQFGICFVIWFIHTIFSHSLPDSCSLYTDNQVHSAHIQILKKDHDSTATLFKTDLQQNLSDLTEIH